MFSPDGTLISASAAPHCGVNIKEKLFQPNELLHALAPHGLCVALITQVPVSRAHAFAE